MGLREDLSYEKKETKTPYIFTGASDIDEALEKAGFAIADAKKFREYAKATGVDVVREDLSTSLSVLFFVMGAAACLFVLWCLGVI